MTYQSNGRVLKLRFEYPVCTNSIHGPNWASAHTSQVKRCVTATDDILRGIEQSVRLAGVDENVEQVAKLALDLMVASRGALTTPGAIELAWLWLEDDSTIMEITDDGLAFALYMGQVGWDQ